MTPTPPSANASSTVSSPGQEDRKRRNIACVNCRNSKVRCRTSQTPGRPCQRCAKLQVSCVVDNKHKRVTKRSKLELLEQELKSIKQVVRPSVGDSSAWTPPNPQIYSHRFRETATIAPSAVVGLRPTVPLPQLPVPNPLAVQSRTGVVALSTPSKPRKDEPTMSRTLGSHAISGEEIDDYFAKYFQYFHPFLPILRHQDPDECYQASKTLFWTILYVACRRYTKDRALFSAVVEYISKDAWKTASDPCLGLDDLHALLLLCTWPLPTIRLMTDSSSSFASIAMTAGLQMGLHTGRGSHNQFCIGTREHVVATDEEASASWLACCIMAQRSASALGYPPQPIQFSDTKCKEALCSPQWAGLLTLFDVQRFSNRFLTSMDSHISHSSGVPEHIVNSWDDEFEIVKPTLVRHDDGISRLHLLAAQVEIRSFYFMRTHGSASNPSSPANILKTFATARNMIDLATDLESREQLLTHSGNGLFRSILNASCIVIAILWSTSSPCMTPEESDALAQRAWGAVLRCSVREGDLPYRACVILETFWSIHHMIPKISVPAGWPDRFSVGVTHWCIQMFKTSLQEVQRSVDDGNREHENTPSETVASRTAAWLVGTPATAHGGLDPFQDVDWSTFMDDFGWLNDGNMLLEMTQ